MSQLEFFANKEPTIQVTEFKTIQLAEPLVQKWEPLIDPSEVKEAKDYGFSFGAKKVGMAPSLVNLRFMCHCLAKAIKMHLDFNPTNANFL